MRGKSNIALQSYEDIFAENAGGEAGNVGESGVVVSIPLSKLHTFPDHPYSVPDNEELAHLAESIQESGILNPVTVLPHPELAGEYYIISGHRRVAAAKKTEIEEVPCIVRNITMAQATVEMVDTNIYREHIPYSEKAKAYRMRMDAIKSMRKEGSIQLETGKRSDQELAEQLGESRANVQRILRLNYLQPELQHLVDSGGIAMNAGVALSYLDKEQQRRVFAGAKEKTQNLTLERAEKIKALADEGELSEANLQAVLVGADVFTKKDVAEALQKHLLSICKVKAGELLVRYGSTLSVVEAEAWLRETKPEGEKSYITSLGITAYEKDGVRLGYIGYVPQGRKCFTVVLPYGQVATNLSKQWTSLFEKQTLLQPTEVQTLCRELLRAALAKTPYSDGMNAENYLLAQNRISFESRLGYGEVTASIKKDAVLFSCSCWKNADVKNTGCRLEELCTVLSEGQKKLQKQADAANAEKERKEAERLEKKRQEWQKSKAAIDAELRDARLLHPSYTLADVEKEAASLKSVSGEMLIYRDAMQLLQHTLTVQETEPRKRWLPEIKAKERAAWLKDYKSWGLWHYDVVLSARYYRWDFVDGAAIVVQDRPTYRSWCGEVELNPVYYHLPSDGLYVTLTNCQSHEQECEKLLAEVAKYQKQHPELKEMFLQTEGSALSQLETVEETADLSEEAQGLEMGM